MVLFKTIDNFVQQFLFAAGILVNLFLYIVNQPSTDFIIAAYFILGGWQVCSVIVHFMMPAKYKVKLRTVYLVLLLITIVAGILCAMEEDALLIFLFVIFFWSPLLAILYMITSHQELKLIKQDHEQAGKENT